MGKGRAFITSAIAGCSHHVPHPLPLSEGVLLQCSSCFLVSLALEQKALVPNMGLTPGTWSWICCPVAPVLGRVQQLWARSLLWAWVPVGEF